MCGSTAPHRLRTVPIHVVQRHDSTLFETPARRPAGSRANPSEPRRHRESTRGHRARRPCDDSPRPSHRAVSPALLAHPAQTERHPIAVKANAIETACGTVKFTGGSVARPTSRYPPPGPERASIAAPDIISVSISLLIVRVVTPNSSGQSGARSPLDRPVAEVPRREHAISQLDSRSPVSQIPIPNGDIIGDTLLSPTRVHCGVHENSHRSCSRILARFMGLGCSTPPPRAFRHPRDQPDTARARRRRHRSISGHLRRSRPCSRRRRIGLRRAHGHWSYTAAPARWGTPSPIASRIASLGSSTSTRAPCPTAQRCDRIWLPMSSRFRSPRGQSSKRTAAASKDSTRKLWRRSAPTRSPNRLGPRVSRLS